MAKQIIHTQDAPAAIACYSQAVAVGNTVYLSGQIGFDPQTMELADGVENQTHQVFKNLSAVIKAADADLTKVVKLNIYLVDMEDFSIINQVMAEYFTKPYPARAAVAVKELPRGALVEVEGVLVK